MLRQRGQEDIPAPVTGAGRLLIKQRQAEPVPAPSGTPPGTQRSVATGATHQRPTADAPVPPGSAAEGHGPSRTCGESARRRTLVIQAHSLRDFHVTLACVAGLTGALRYFEARAADSSEYREALEAARLRITAVDSVVRALDERRKVLGLSKAELARQAGMRPEVVRRLLGAGPANPTLATVISLASAMSLDVTISGPDPATDGQSDASGTHRRTA
jgi:DNA-binding phage protein